MELKMDRPVRGSDEVEQLLVDIGIITGFVATSYVVMKAAPHVKPMAGVLIQRARPHLNQLTNRITGVPTFIHDVLLFLRRNKNKKRRSFVRWLGSNLPNFLFGPTPRICILLKGMDEVDIRKDLRRLSQVNLHVKPALSELEDCNDDGIIIAYAKGSDTETESIEPMESILDTVSNMDGLWGNTNMTTIHFDPSVGGCSTPKKSRINNWIRNNTLDDFPYHNTMNDSRSENQAETAAKVEALEAELKTMKAMIQSMLQNQGTVFVGPPVPPPIPGLRPPPPSPMSGLPPPPPPPPPPMMPIASKASQPVIKLRVKSELSAVSSSDYSIGENTTHPPSLSDVLKGLSSVKLKPTPRSPGGTPFKVTKPRDPFDPASMIAAALQKRFARIQSPATTDTEDDTDKSTGTGPDKENQGGINDSFNQSPSVFIPRRISLKSREGWSPPSSPLSNGHDVLLKSFRFSPLNTSRKRKSIGLEPAVEKSPVPLFGQHLLKRRVSSSLQKKQNISLREQNRNPGD